MNALKIVGIILLILLVVITLVPLIVPVPPLKNTTSAAALADVDSRFVDVQGVSLHTKVYGSGTPVMILLHGFGASTFSWREVVESLSRHGTVIVYDRPAFGLTQRPLAGEWQGESPYSPQMQPELLIGLMDALGVEKAILVGNSAGGTVAVQTALLYPQRVQTLVLVDAAILSDGAGAPAWARWILDTPQAARLGPLAVRSLETRGVEFLKTAWHDPTKITEDVLEGYRKPLRVENWDKSLWELTRASQPSGLRAQLSTLNLPVLVVTGDDDRIVPTAQSLELAGLIPGAELVVFKNCGHVPHEECPADFLAAVEPFIQNP